MKSPFLLLIVPMLLLESCRVGPRYTSPCNEVPVNWKNTHVSDDLTEGPKVYTTTLGNWWEVFNDPLLNSLEKAAIEKNPTLDIALAKVLQARALAGVEAASLYPQLNLNPSFINQGILTKAYLPPVFSTIPGFPAAQLNDFRIHQQQYMLPLNLNYELDLWGQLQDRYESALFNAEAEIQNYNTMLLTLTADLAINYFQLRTLDAQENLLKETIDRRQSNYELTLSRFKKGLVNFLDVTQSEIDLATAKANLNDAIRRRMLAEDQIAALSGEYASEFMLTANPLMQDPPPIPTGLPSEILLNRPDIAAAERTMASEHALIGAAYASFYPSINLTAALGFSSPDIHNFLKWISRYWSFGANMGQMVFDGGRDCANLQAAIARFKQASGSYQKIIVKAFQEVEDALSNIEQFDKQSKHLNEAVIAARKATKLSKNRYINGVAIYLEVVENERLSLQTEINWLSTLNFRYSSTVQLIKALGGSLKLPDTSAACWATEGG